MVISRQPSADDSLIYCCVAPLNAYSHIMPGTLPFCLSMLAMSLLLDALMALILANWIYQPISGIVRTVRAYPHAIPDDHQKSELDEIRDHIIQMQNENDLQREKVDEYIELLQNAQMNALQSQINPHFLYNTLESIADRMIMLANGENICSDMLLLLARLGGIEYAHTHGAMTTLRAYQRMAHVTGDMSWNEKPELFRRRIAEKHYESVAGDIPEGFPMSPRNESCSTADWMQLNLWAGLLLSGEAADSAYAKAEHIFWNALAGSTIPAGYEGASFSSMDFRVELPAADESGFYPLNHLPLPNWIFYEESPDSRTSFENVSVTVPIVFDDGQRADVRFWPLCYFVSTLTFYALPLLFRL